MQKVYFLIFLFKLTSVVATDPACHVLSDVDINPHHPGIGHVAGSSVDECCAICRSPTWWSKGCRFSTLSRGSCWFKADNKTVVKSPGKQSVGCSSMAPPPAPPPPLPPKGNTGPWERLGPWNIGDDIYDAGEAGTLADAASPAKNPDVVYAGGQNNGASSGVLKSIDRGRHWRPMGNGMFVTRIEAVYIVDELGQHVLAAAINGIYESIDGAESWQFINESAKLGVCNTFKNGTIGGVPHVFAGCSAGVANVPVIDGGGARLGQWMVIPPGGMQRTYISVSDALVNNSVVGACVSGHVWVGHVLNRTAANWTKFGAARCVMVAINPNDADHIMFVHPPSTMQTRDGGKTFENLHHSNTFHCGIDRQGWMYTAAMGGAYRSMDQGKTWQHYHVVRVQRRTNRTVDRVPHDYQRISLDFAGGVAFPSDQGLFVKPPGNDTKLISFNGNMSNNIAMKVAVAAGEGPDKRYLVTTAWDWAPLASWDSGKHWPSWQAPLDGGSASCIGEGGGAYALGASNHTLVMHRHNILHSSMGGKNLSRFVPPHNPIVYGPTYATRVGSRSEPNGNVFAPMFAGLMPWNETADKIITCDDAEQRGDLGLHTNFSCLAAVDLGVSYGWYKDINYAVWRGHSDKHCHICRLAGNASSWKYVDAPGAWSYALRIGEATAGREKMLKQFDADGDGVISASDLRATQDKAPVDKDEEEDVAGGGDDDGDPFNPLAKLWERSRERRDANGGHVYVIKNFNYGAGNWTWSLLPAHMQTVGIGGFVNDPTDGGRALYGVGTNCIARSDDQGDSWGPCWNISGAVNNIASLVIKDSKTMFIIRRNDVPLRTRDGGATWQPLKSCERIKTVVRSMAYSWTGKTLALFANGGSQSAVHPHTAYVWRSTDDGDTWTDETEDIVTMGAGISQWYENKLYLSSAGQGILSKVFE